MHSLKRKLFIHCTYSSSYYLLTSKLVQVLTIFIITTAGVKCCGTAVKCHTNFISVLLYFFWSFGINDSNTFSVENWILLKLVIITFLYSFCIKDVTSTKLLNLHIKLVLQSKFTETSKYFSLANKK